MARKASGPKQSEWKPIFLQILSETGIVKRACETAGINRRTAYMARDRSKEFFAQWQEALDIAADAVEDVVMTVALGGEDINTSKWVLSRLKPERYGDKRQVDVTGATEFDVDLNFSISGDEVKAEIKVGTDLTEALEEEVHDS